MSVEVTIQSSNFSTPLLEEKNALIKSLMDENVKFRDALIEIRRLLEGNADYCASAAWEVAHESLTSEYRDNGD